MGTAATQANKRYKEKVYKRCVIQLRKELAAQWESKLEEEGKTKNGFIREKIEEYVQGE